MSLSSESEQAEAESMPVGRAAGSGDVSHAVLAAVIESYYPDQTRAGSASRARAQSAQAVAAVLATGLVTTLTFADLRQQSLALRLIGLLAVLSWASASWLYMRAVGAVVPFDERTVGVDDPDRLVRIVLDRAKVEREGVDRRQRWANGASLLALVLTGIVFAVGILVPASRSVKPARLVLTTDQASLLPSNCAVVGGTVAGAVVEESLATDFVEFHADCRGVQTRLMIPRSDLKGLVVLE